MLLPRRCCCLSDYLRFVSPGVAYLPFLVGGYGVLARVANNVGSAMPNSRLHLLHRPATNSAKGMARRRNPHCKNTPRCRTATAWARPLPISCIRARYACAFVVGRQFDRFYCPLTFAKNQRATAFTRALLYSLETSVDALGHKTGALCVTCWRPYLRAASIVAMRLLYPLRRAW